MSSCSALAEGDGDQLCVAVDERVHLPECRQEGRVMELLFLPGFCTVSTLTETSGRGVGVDAAQTNLEHFGGALRIDSRFREGASFVLP